MINAIWFVVLSFMLTGYAVLDGFDLGVGALHLILGRNSDERQTAIAAIGPVWNGNEVWLLAAGGSMVVAFPHLYAAAFSGFYLALMLVLWLLILRGLGIEFRHQVEDPLWHHVWDLAFSVSSLLLAVLFGVAFGNVLRGVPLDADGNFQGSFALLLNPFSILCGVLSIATLSLHGAAYLAMKTTGDLQARARSVVRSFWLAVTVLLVAVAAASFVVQPGFTGNFSRMPLLLVVPLVGIAALVAIPLYAGRQQDGRVFFATSALIAGTLGSAAAGLFPKLLPALEGSRYPALDIYNTASPPGSQQIALVIYLIGMAIVIVYLSKIYRVWRGKIRPGEAYHV
jgi:cytochrome d ubiquinol oxidase subunit II